MTTENTNSPADAGESALSQPSISLDDAANLDFYDPSEDNEEVEQEQQSNDEPVEAEDEESGQETEESADEDATVDEDEAETADEAGEAEPKDDVTVALPSGEKVALSELKSGYMRQADYSRKTQETAAQRRDLEALATSVTNSVNAIAEHLTKTLPPAPDPQLAVTYPGEYVRKKALHDQAMAGIAEVLKMAQAPKDATNKLTEQQHADLIKAETAKLNEAFPQTKTQEGHKKFFDAAAQTARELGYSDDEIASAVDHRLFKLAHYARLGMQAEAAKAKAKQKVVNAPPVAPNKRQQSANAANRQRNREAMKKLRQSGSLEDALAVDWD